MKNLLKSIPKNISKELFETLVENEHIHIERIISQGHTSPKKGWYNQEKNEWMSMAVRKLNETIKKNNTEMDNLLYEKDAHLAAWLAHFEKTKVEVNTMYMAMTQWLVSKALTPPPREVFPQIQPLVWPPIPPQEQGAGPQATQSEESISSSGGSVSTNSSDTSLTPKDDKQSDKD